MMITLPSVSVNFGGKSKDLEKKTEPTNQQPQQFNYGIDPTMLLMGTALVLLCAAMLVYAARS